jgi:hypothetical protein
MAARTLVIAVLFGLFGAYGPKNSCSAQEDDKNFDRKDAIPARKVRNTWASLYCVDKIPHGSNRLYVHNPYKVFAIAVGVRFEGRGRNIIINPRSWGCVSLPDGAFDIYMEFGHQPNVAYKSESKLKLKNQTLKLEFDYSDPATPKLVPVK